VDPLAALAACGVVAVGSAVQGAAGFGVALIAAPVLVLLDPTYVPAPLLVAALLLTLLMTWRDRRSIHMAGLRWSVVGRIPGTLLAMVVLSVASAEALSLWIGALTLAAVAMSASGVHLRPTATTVGVAGAVSGFMGTISSIGGPPIALVYQHSPGHELRGTLSGFFVIGAVISLAALAATGYFGLAELALAAVLLPGVVLGFAVSGRLAARIDRGYTRVAVLALSALAGVGVLLRHLL